MAATPNPNFLAAKSAQSTQTGAQGLTPSSPFPWKGLGGNGNSQDLASVPLLPLPALFVTHSGHSIAAPVPFGNR